MIAPAFISDRLTGPRMAAGRTSRRLGGGAVERRAGDMPAAVSWTPARAAAGTIAGAGGSVPSVLPTNCAGPPPRAIAEQVSRAAGVIGADISAGSARPGCWTASSASVKVPAGGGLVERLTVEHFVEPPLACHRQVSRVRVLRQSRALRPQRHEAGQDHDDERRVDDVQHAAVEPHDAHARCWESPASADLRIILLRRH